MRSFSEFRQKWRVRMKQAFRKLLYYLLITCYVVGNCVILPSSVSATSCQSVQFIFARGSGEDLDGPSYSAWRDSIDQKMHGALVSYGFYELGSAQYDGHQYPAVSVSDGFSGVTNLIGAAISGGELFNFGKSVDEGTAELKAYISNLSQQCPNTKFVLGGYSQGAMVISRTLGELDASRIVYVSTFGDPKLYLPEGKTQLLKKPDACYGRNLSNYRINVADCYAYEGVLGSYQPYQPEKYVDKLGTWCNKADIMCSSKISTKDHTSYVSENLYEEAASVIVSKVFDHFGVRETTSPTSSHDVAFLVDNTHSMDTKHERYGELVEGFAERVVGSGGRVALYEFGDLAQGVKTHEQCNFSCTLDEFKAGYDRIGSSGGDDRPESALSGLMTTMNSLDWTNGATKSVIVLTDAGFHNPDYDGTTLDAVVKRSLEIDPVNVFVIDASIYVGAYHNLIARTNGGFIKAESTVDDLLNQILLRPVAKLKLMEYYAEVGATLEFDASDSYAEDGSKLTFSWDLDGDGAFEENFAKSVISKKYNRPFDGFVQVKITDQQGNAATMSAHVRIDNDKTLEEKATIRNFSTQRTDGRNKISFSTTGSDVLLVTDNTPVGWVEVTSGAGEVVVDDLEESTKFALVPYSQSGVRGERYNFELYSEADSGNSPADPGENNGSVGSRPSNTNLDKKQAKLTDLPKVPNAGIYINDR